MRQNYNKKRQLNKLKASLLLLMMVGFATSGAFAQHDMTIPDGLKMNKTYVPDDFTGETGNIFVEVFVTGHSVATHVPTDIVLVLDVSGSMDQNMTSYNYTARASQGYSYNSYANNTYYYLHTDGNYYAVQRQRTGNWWDNPRYCRLRFQIGNTWYYLSGTGVTTTAPNNVTDTGTEIWRGVLYTRQTVTQNKMQALKNAVNNFVNTIAQDATDYNVDHRISIVKYAIDEYYGSEESVAEGNHRGAVGSSGGSSTSNYNYTEVVVNRRDPRTDSDEIHDRVNALVASGATAADYGMKKAQYVLAQIPANAERSKVVVMFTDGEPTYVNGFQNAVANATIENAYILKHSGTINGSTVDFDAQVFTIGVFDNPSTNTLNYMAYTSSNYLNAHSMTNAGTATPNVNYAYTAESSEGLNDIFTTIAGASGAMSLPAATIVQDMVSPNFHLPSNASGTVTAYAPKCLSYNETTDEYTFEGLSDAGFLTIGSIPDPQHPGQTINGVVTGGAENRLPNNFVTIVDNKVQMSGFNFSENWCGYTTIGGTNVIHGRKVVLKIPIVASNGMWGDGMFTNDPEESFVQIGDTYYGPFNNPTANVLGSVWTEVITKAPANFDPMNIDSPEDLAWFISLVNGRIGYNVIDNVNSNTVASHPSQNGRLTADIDMSAHNWVPIGTGYQVRLNETTGLTEYVMNGENKVNLVYSGIFDGNGHVITGLKTNASKFYKLNESQQSNVVVFPGMFSDVNGTVKNVFVLDADFRGKRHTDQFTHFGIIADTLSSGGLIFNCEAAGRIICNNDNPSMDNFTIYGGLVGLNNGGTIHSCMAMAELTGYTMGGMIGENRSGTFTNGFTNGVYNYIGTVAQAKPVGGIAAINNGSISNCYVRFSRESSGLLTNTGFHQVVGQGDYTQASCYTPSHDEHSIDILTVNTAWNSTIPSIGESSSYYTNTRNQSRVREDRSNDNMVGGTWSTVVEGEETYKILSGGIPLLTKLNAGAGTSYTPWKRTTAIGNNYHLASSPDGGNINGDYPVLQIKSFGDGDEAVAVTCLGSADGIRIDYASSLNEMLHRHNTGAMNENTAISNAYTSSNPNYYKVAEHDAIYLGAINLYANDDVTLATTGGKDGVADNCTAEGMVVYIDENISLLQDESSNITAYTGQTIKDFGSSFTAAGNRWHNVSSSLSGSKFGWSYIKTGQIEHSYDPNPCGWELEVANDDEAVFPSDTRSFHAVDFYCFFEPQYHWINFRRNGQSHWHMDLINDAVSYDEPTNHAKIDYYYNQPNTNYTQFTKVYDNETSFIPGKGYLMALYTEYFANRHLWNDNNDGSKNGQFVQNRGILNNGTITIPVTYTAANEWTGLAGYNLLGNPYQSYLDFATFASVNSDLWNGDANAMTYAVYDPTLDIYAQATAAGQASQGAYAATGDINMHQGFFICVKNKNGGTATFNNTMRSNTPASGTHFRGERLNYPVINLIVTDSEGNNDVAVLEVGRPENGGGEKLRVGSATGRISLRHDNTDFGILFSDMTEGSQPLRFETEEDGTFTLSWNTANANFSSLTLVDNITGVHYDMLAHDSYEFEGRASDYKSRFKILIGEFTDIEENEETVTNNFAFFDGSEWVVNGQGQLTVADVMGRTVYTDNLTNDQNRVSLNGLSQGVYLMQVRNANGTMVQKIVVR